MCRRSGNQRGLITQAEVERLLVLREEALDARATAAKKQGELETEEQRLIGVLDAGAAVEPGRYFALVITKTTNRSVAWRKVVEAHLGKPFAEKILADTAPGEERVLKVVQEVNTASNSRR